MNKLLKYITASLLLLPLAACNKDDGEQGLGNDCINRSRTAPYIVGETVEMVYAMYMPFGTGKIVSASVSASFPGGRETRMEHRAFSADDQGQDYPTVVGNPCVTEGEITTVDFIVDTCAASLRYYYVIPDVARDKDISFRFSVVDNHGRSAHYDVGPCKVRKMDIFRDVQLTNDICYFSLADMKGYTGPEADFYNIPVDLVWTYLTKPANVDAGSTFISPTALDKIAPYMTKVPTPPSESLMRQTEKMRFQSIVETQLAGQEYNSLFIDDIDFETLDIPGSTEYIMGLVARRGFWVETADGKYRAYIYVVSATTNVCTMNIKRYQMY